MSYIYIYSFFVLNHDIVYGVSASIARFQSRCQCPGRAGFDSRYANGSLFARWDEVLEVFLIDFDAGDMFEAKTMWLQHFGTIGGSDRTSANQNATNSHLDPTSTSLHCAIISHYAP